MQLSLLVFGMVCVVGVILVSSEITNNDENNYLKQLDNGIENTSREGDPISKRNGEYNDEDYQQAWKSYYDSYPASRQSQIVDKATMAAHTLAASPGILALIGGIALGFTLAYDHKNLQNSINDLSSKKDSICTTAKALGNTAITGLTAAEDTALDGTAANIPLTRVVGNIVAALNNYATPTC